MNIEYGLCILISALAQLGDPGVVIGQYTLRFALPVVACEVCVERIQ